MMIADLMPSDVPPELRVKIEKVMQRERFSWRDAVLSLAREVVSPSAEEARETRSASLRLCVKSKKGARKARRSSAVFSCPKGGFTPRGAAGNKRREAEMQRSRGGVK